MSAQHFIFVDRFVFSPPVLTLPAVFLFVQVARHLTKLFDSLAKLKFVMGSDGKEQKMASGMYSKDGEYVDMDSQCDLSGQVCRGGTTLISFLFFRVICGLCVFCELCISVVIVFVRRIHLHYSLAGGCCFARSLSCLCKFCRGVKNR